MHVSIAVSIAGTHGRVHSITIPLMWVALQARRGDIYAGFVSLRSGAEDFMHMRKSAAHRDRGVAADKSNE